MLDASFGCKRSKVAGWRGDNGHATTHEVNHERREAIEFALQPVVLHQRTRCPPMGRLTGFGHAVSYIIT